jgi:hypothetical protein
VRSLLDARLVDFVAMDLKAPWPRYARPSAHGRHQRLAETISLLRTRAIPHQLARLGGPASPKPTAPRALASPLARPTSGRTTGRPPTPASRGSGRHIMKPATNTAFARSASAKPLRRTDPAIPNGGCWCFIAISRRSCSPASPRLTAAALHLSRLPRRRPRAGESAG